MNKIEIQTAQRALNAIIAAHKQADLIDIDTVSGTPELADVFDDVATFCNLAGAITIKLKTAIDNELSALESRDLKPVIAKAARRILDSHAAIEYENAVFASKVSADKIQRQALIDKRFTAEQISLILSPLDFEGHALKIQALKDEKIACEQFVADWPRYDMALIEGFI